MSRPAAFPLALLALRDVWSSSYIPAACAALRSSAATKQQPHTVTVSQSQWRQFKSLHDPEVTRDILSLSLPGTQPGEDDDSGGGGGGGD